MISLGQASRAQTDDPWDSGAATAFTLVIACGALARELVQVVRANGLTHIAVACLPAILHNRPERIAPAVRAKIEAEGGRYSKILVLYGDCGTGGELDRVLADTGAERIAGPHCYAFLAGTYLFDRLAEAEPGTFYLTDYLARHFDKLVWEGLGLDRFPELLPTYFGHYTRVLYLAQSHDPALVAQAGRAADRLGLAFAMHKTGLDGLERFLSRHHTAEAA